MPATPNTGNTEQRIALIDFFHAMWNTQNVSGVLACFTEDAVVTMVCPQHQVSLVYHGVVQIRDFVEQTIVGCVIRARSHHRVDDRMIWTATMTNEQLRQVGVDAVRNRNEAVIREGKIAAYIVTVTPETVATLNSVAGWSLEHVAYLGA